MAELRTKAEKELQELREKLTREMEEEKCVVMKAHDGVIKGLREQLASEVKEVRVCVFGCVCVCVCVCYECDRK